MKQISILDEIIVDNFARCGYAVPPPFAEALVRANLPELCDTEDTGRYSKVV